MEKIYKLKTNNKVKGSHKVSRVLFSTVYSTADPIMLAATKFGVERIFLLVDIEPDKNQQNSIDLIKKSLGNVIEVKLIKAKLYDIVNVAKEAVRSMDDLSDKDEIYVNITGSRRTQAFGLLYAAYARIKKVKQIVYVTQEEKKLVFLPKLSYDLNNSQRKILEVINKKKSLKLSEFAKELDISKGMLYRTIIDLQNLGLITLEEKEGYKLTDAGRIVRL